MGLQEDTDAARQKTGQVDRNGFFLDSALLEKGVDQSGVPLALPKAEIQKQRKRESKWIEMLSNWDHWMAHKAAKVKSRCRKGIPPSLRGRAWNKIIGSDKLKEQNPGAFEKYIAEADGDNVPEEVKGYMDIIDRDLDRTFPHNDIFSSKDGDGQKTLRDVLRAYAMYNKEVGYCQGMGMIAGTLLMQMPAEDCFWCMVRLLDEVLNGFFDAGLVEIQICADVLHGLIEIHSPALHQHLSKHDMTPLLYFTDWFMCAYVKTVPWESVLRIWDMLIFEGVKILYRVALAILLQSETHLLKECPDNTDLMMYLREVPLEIVKPGNLIPFMLKLKLKSADIEVLHAKVLPKYEENRKKHSKVKEQEKPTMEGAVRL